MLDWHFTDRYYHTNLDTPDKTSPAEMRNVGGRGGADRLAACVRRRSRGARRRAGGRSAAGRARLAKEQDTTELPAAAEAVAAWRKWYGEAVRSVGRWWSGSAPAFDAKVRHSRPPRALTHADGEMPDANVDD